MTISVETIVALLENAIEDGDAERTLMLVGELKKSLATTPEAVRWVTEPNNLTALHDMLVEHLDVPQKVMRVKERSENRARRAHMFVEAMEHGIKRVL
jgi:hypothetical protein